MIRVAIAPTPGAPGVESTWDAAKALLQEDDAEHVLWVDVVNPSDQLVEELAAAFRLHPLTIEDLVHQNQRAKVEEYPSYLFVVMQWLTSKTAKHPCELHCVLGRNFLLSVADTREAKIDKVPPVDAAWARFRAGTARGPVGADGVLYRVLDELVDSHLPRVDELEEEIEVVNERVLDGAEESAAVVQEIVMIRRRLTQFRRMLAPARDVLSSLARRDYTHVHDKTALFFRDVQDHLNRTYEAIESLREFDEMVMDVQLAMAESRRSIVIKRLTIVSTIFLPMSFLASFFGMNFTTIPFDSLALLWGGIGAMIVVPAAFMAWFAAKRWV